MVRLIDLNALLLELKKIESEYYASEFEEDNIMGLGVMMAISKVKDARTIEAEPVRYKKWIKCTPFYDKRLNEYIEQWECSECGYYYPDYAEEGKPNYCPYCGAKMNKRSKKK